MIKHLVGTHSADTVQALKDQLGVTELEVELIQTAEQYYELLQRIWPYEAEQVH